MLNRKLHKHLILVSDNQSSLTKIPPLMCVSASRRQHTPTTTLLTVHTHAHTHTSRPLHPLQRLCGLPCSAKQDKSHLGQTSVSSKERQKGGMGRTRETVFLPTFSSPSSPLFRFDGQTTMRAKDQTGEGRKSYFKRVCVCVCVWKHVLIQSCGSISFSSYFLL